MRQKNPITTTTKKTFWYMSEKMDDKYPSLDTSSVLIHYQVTEVHIRQARSNPYSKTQLRTQRKINKMKIRKLRTFT